MRIIVRKIVLLLHAHSNYACTLEHQFAVVSVRAQLSQTQSRYVHAINTIPRN